MEGRGLARLTGLKDLRELDLDGARIDDEVLGHVGKMTGLMTLRLSHTDVTEPA